VATFGEFIYGPDTEEAAATIAVLAETFCTIFPINQQWQQAGNAGVLFGRYPGDVYFGGNPWPLLSAVTAETFYKGASLTLQKAAAFNALSSPADKPKWAKLLHLDAAVSNIELAQAQISAGDAILNFVYQQTFIDNNNIFEQIDKFSGFQVSAESLTWSYANILNAMKEGGYASVALDEARMAAAKER